MILTHLVLFSFLNGASPSGAVVAPVPETFSGGWRKPQAPYRQREQTDEEIHAERVRMGILPPDPIDGDETVGLSTSLSTEAGGSAVGSYAYNLAAHLLPEDLAALDALAAQAAYLTIEVALAARARDEELVRLLRLDEYLRDEDDAAVLMLAIATLH